MPGSTATQPAGKMDHLDVTGLGKSSRGLLLMKPLPGIPVVEGKKGVDLSLDAGTTQAAVFSRAKAMALASIAWTKNKDKKSIGLTSRLEVPLKVWIARKRSADEKESPKHRIGHELGRARKIFESMGTGVTFKAVVTKTDADVTVFSDEEKPWAKLCKIGHEQGVLNVYCVNGVGGGWTRQKPGLCPTARNSIIIYPDAEQETLAHELGHALTLGVDDEGDPRLGGCNLMSFDGADGRTRLTLGQAYAVNVAKESAVCRFGLRSELKAPDVASIVDAPRPWLAGDKLAVPGQGASPTSAWLDGSEDRAASHLGALLKSGRGAIPRLDSVLHRGELQAGELERHRNYLETTCQSKALRDLYQRLFVCRRQRRAAQGLAAFARAGEAAAMRRLQTAAKRWEERPGLARPEIRSLVRILLEDLHREAPNRRVRAPGAARARGRRIVRLQPTLRLLLAAQNAARVAPVARRGPGR